MRSHEFLITVSPRGLVVTASVLEGSSPDDVFDFNSERDCVLFAKVISQLLFAYTCLPPSDLSADTLQWINSSPSNDSDHGTDECVLPSSTK